MNRMLTIALLAVPLILAEYASARGAGVDGLMFDPTGGPYVVIGAVVAAAIAVAGWRRYKKS